MSHFKNDHVPYCPIAIFLLTHYYLKTVRPAPDNSSNHMFADKVCISKPTCAEELEEIESAAIEQCHPCQKPVG